MYLLAQINDIRVLQDDSIKSNYTLQAEQLRPWWKFWAPRWVTIAKLSTRQVGDVLAIASTLAIYPRMRND